MENDNPLRFQDGYPIHWFSRESCKELSEAAGEHIPWQSFRPQIVVYDMPPQYEHKLFEGTLSGIRFIDPKPCDRCPITLVNPITGEIRKSKEPLRSLSKYKKWRNQNGELKVIFGENMLPLAEGVISIGDEMQVRTLRDPPLIYSSEV